MKAVNELAACPAAGCGGDGVLVQYTEVAFARFDKNGGLVEDGYDIQSYEYDFQRAFCKTCGVKRALTRAEIELLDEVN